MKIVPYDNSFDDCARKLQMWLWCNLYVIVVGIALLTEGTEGIWRFPRTLHGSSHAHHRRENLGTNINHHLPSFFMQVNPRRALEYFFNLQSRRSTMSSIAGHLTTYQIIKAGSGAKVEKGKTVTVHATGTVLETNKKFWSTKDKGQQAFTYRAGVGEVITGWDQGLLGMLKDETRRLTIPAAEGYGAKGFPAWGIPPGATLQFDLEVLTIQ